MPFVDGDGWMLVPGRFVPGGFAVPTEDDGAELANLPGNRLPNRVPSPAPAPVPVIHPVRRRLPCHRRPGESTLEHLSRRQMAHRSWTAKSAKLLVPARAVALRAEDPEWWLYVGREWWCSDGGRRSAIEDVEVAIGVWAQS